MLKYQKNKLIKCLQKMYKNVIIKKRSKMKKWIGIFIISVLVVVTVVIYNYNSYRSDLLSKQQLNQEYENYVEGEIVGTSLMTLINKTMDLNKKNNVQLDNNSHYIDNDIDSIKIDVKFLESDDTYPMESIAKQGSESFIKNYAAASFKCTNKQYHEKTNNIKYLLFEEIQLLIFKFYILNRENIIKPDITNS